MGIFIRVKRLLSWMKERFFRLNVEQRKKISDFCDKLATGALVPVALKLMSDGQAGDGWFIFSWLLCAGILATVSVAALAAKEEDEDDG